MAFSFSDLRTAFNDTDPIALGDYYHDGTLAVGVNGTSIMGYPLSLSMLKSKSPHVPSSLISTLRGTSSIEVRQIANTNDEGFVICGLASNSMNYHKIDPDAANPANTAIANSNFIIKFTKNGDFVWAATIASSTPEAITVADDDSIYVSGTYNNTSITFKNSDASVYTIPISMTLVGGNDVFLVKYSSSGFVQWVTTMGGGQNDNRVNITTSDNNSVIVVGNKGASTTAMTFKDKLGSTKTLSANSTLSEVFIAKYDQNGLLDMNSGLGWVARINGNLSVNASSGAEPAGRTRVCITRTNDYSVFVGVVSSSTTLNARSKQDTSTTKTITSSGDNAFIVKYTYLGEIATISGNPFIVIIGGSSTETTLGIDVNTFTQDVVITGLSTSSSYTITSPNGTTTTISGTGNRKCYYCAFDSNGTFISSAYVNSPTSTAMPRDVVACSDKGYLISGSYYNNLDIYDSSLTLNSSISSLTTSWCVYIVKYSRTGNVEWKCYIRTLGNSWVMHAIRTLNSEYLMAGLWDRDRVLTFTDINASNVSINTNIGSNGSWNTFIIRLGRNGTI